MASMFDIITENAVLSAKTAILEEAAGTQTGERYVYIIEAAGDTLKKAKDFVVNNKGKLAALAGAAALAGGAYEAHKHNWGGINDKLGLNKVENQGELVKTDNEKVQNSAGNSDKIHDTARLVSTAGKEDAEKQIRSQLQDAIKKGDKAAMVKYSGMLKNADMMDQKEADSIYNNSTK